MYSVYNNYLDMILISWRDLMVFSPVEPQCKCRDSLGVPFHDSRVPGSTAWWQVQASPQQSFCSRDLVRGGFTFATPEI